MNDRIIMEDIERYIKRDNEHIRKVMDYCKKQNKKQSEIIREVFEDIKRYNQKKYDKMRNSNTPGSLRASLWFEDFTTKALMATQGVKLKWKYG